MVFLAAVALLLIVASVMWPYFAGVQYGKFYYGMRKER
jgi:hypothetical protein